MDWVCLRAREELTAGLGVPGAGWRVRGAWRVACAVIAVWCAGPGAAAAHAQTPPQTTARQGPPPALPLTQLDDQVLAADLDNRAFTLTFAQPVPIRDLLLLLVRGTNLSVVPDPAITGTFIGELKNVTVRQALGLILQPLGLDYTVDGPFVKVFRREPETRLFDINYIAAERAGSSSVGGEASAGGSFVRVTTTTGTDLFAEIDKGLRTLLSDRAAFNVDRKAGLLQVTDFPERLERVAMYLEAVHDRVHQQVQIDARVIEVELNDATAQSLDWAALAQGGGQPGALSPTRPLMSGLRAGDVPRFLAAVAAQGKVSVLASPRVLVLNNEPAVIRATSRASGSPREASDQGITLGVTPQIAVEGIVMLSLSPIVSQTTPGTDDASAVTAVRETDTLARVADGETIVVAGFTRDHEVRERRSVGLTGGWFGRSTVVTKKRVELLILLTPKILVPVGTR